MDVIFFIRNNKVKHSFSLKKEILKRLQFNFVQSKKRESENYKHLP